LRDTTEVLMVAFTPFDIDLQGINGLGCKF
jgi:hypothetical protein